MLCNTVFAISGRSVLFKSVLVASKELSLIFTSRALLPSAHASPGRKALFKRERNRLHRGGSSRARGTAETSRKVMRSSGAPCIAPPVVPGSQRVRGERGASRVCFDSWPPTGRIPLDEALQPTSRCLGKHRAKHADTRTQRRSAYLLACSRGMLLICTRVGRPRWTAG